MTQSNELKYFVIGRSCGEHYHIGPLTEEELRGRIDDGAIKPRDRMSLSELGYDSSGFALIEGREVSLEPVEIVKVWKVKK